MKRTISICIGLVILSGCDFILMAKGIPGSGQAAHESREIADFHAIDFSGGGNIEFVIADAPSCEVECDDNLLQYVVTEVVNGTLKIYSRENISPKSGLRLTLTSSQLDAVDIAGACKGSFAKLDSSALSVDLAGSGDLKFDGKTDQLEVEIAGSGNVNALRLSSKDAKISIAGSGDIVLDVNETLDVSIAGSGRVQYRGAATISKSIAGSGSVKKIKDESATDEV